MLKNDKASIAWHEGKPMDEIKRLMHERDKKEAEKFPDRYNLQELKEHELPHWGKGK